MTAPAPTIDARVAELLAAGTPDQAAVLVLETHGPGIFRMLRGVFHDDDVAEDLYQRFSMELWKSIARFEGRSSVYTWAYVLARRTVSWRLRQGEHKREQRLKTGQEEALLAEHWSRTATPAWQRTEESALADAAAVNKEAARLRKRFERVKGKLRVALT